MNDLITITEREGQKVVSARELHTFLEVSEKFADWCKRMIGNQFDEEIDFIRYFGKSTGGRPSVDYALTLDTAKEWSMLQRNDKGKEARRYFIQKEKEANQLHIDLSDPNTFFQIGENLKREQDKRIAAEKQVAKLAPKADLADKITTSTGNVSMSEAAKLLNLDHGRNILYQKLREKGIFFKHKNEPKQIYVNNSCFELVAGSYVKPDGERVLYTKTEVTPKGIAYLHKVFGTSALPVIMVN